MTGALVTGAASGLGRFLHRALGGDGLTRVNAGSLLAGPGARVIVHCAPDLGLAERLLSLSHERFVLASSVDVYPEGGGPWGEESAVSGRTPYAADKLAAERLALGRGRAPLVLRLGTLLGADARPNSLTRLLDGTALSVAPSSRFAWLRHRDVLEFLTAALDRGLEGTYNVVPSRTATLAEAARALGRSPAWGTHLYAAPEADGAKARAVCAALTRSALENAIAFAKERG